MVWRTDTLKMGFKPDATRFTDEELEKMAKAEPAEPRQGARQGNPAMMETFRARMALTRALNNFFTAEKPALVLSMGRQRDARRICSAAGRRYGV